MRKLRADAKTLPYIGQLSLVLLEPEQQTISTGYQRNGLAISLSKWREAPGAAASHGYTGRSDAHQRPPRPPHRLGSAGAA